METARSKVLKPYRPGEQLKGDFIKLNANENPYPPAMDVIDEITAFIKKNPKALTLYPDPDSNELRDSIAKMINETGGVLSRAVVSERQCLPSEEDKLPFLLTRDMVYVGNGSDEVLSFLFYAFIERACVTSALTYSFYPVYCSYYGVERVAVPMGLDNAVDIIRMAQEAKERNCALIVTNPNAPTGVGIGRKELIRALEIAPRDKAFIIDEAYCDFGGESGIGLLEDFQNLIIVRTFSKSLCGAALRLGYVISNKDVIKIIHKVKNCVNHFPLDALTQKAGCAITKNLSYYIDCARAVARERDDFFNYLKSIGAEVFPSKTNFLLAKFPNIKGDDLYERVKKRGILIRHFDDETRDFVRITIGTRDEMKKLRAIINDILL